MQAVGTLTKKLEKNLWEVLKKNPDLATLEESAFDTLYNHPEIRKYTSQIEHYHSVDGTKELFESIVERTVGNFEDSGMLHLSRRAGGSSRI